MTVMRKTGLIVVSAWEGSLFQLSLQDGHLLKNQIERPCKHDVHLLCVQVAGHEYLALSCYYCKNIKLMDLNKRLEVLEGNGRGQSKSDSQKVKYELITAFSGEKVFRMCHGSQNRILVRSFNDVLELDTSSKAFNKVKIIKTSTSRNVVLRHPFPDLCYVPDPHRLIYICERDHTNVVYCDDNESEWLVKRVRNLSYPGNLLYVPSHDVILVADMDENTIKVFNLGLRSQTQHLMLPDDICNIRCLCWFNNQVMMASGERTAINQRISYFSPK